MDAHNTNALIVDKSVEVSEIVNSAHLMAISVAEIISRMTEAVPDDRDQKVMFGALYLAESVEKLLGEASETLERQDLDRRKQQGAHAHALDDVAKATAIASRAQERLAVVEDFVKAIADAGEVFDIPTLKRLAAETLASSAEVEFDGRR